MSPSAKDLEGQIGRQLRKGDILVISERSSASVSTTIDSYYEVTDPSVESLVKRFLRKGVVAECIEARVLTPLGPAEGRILYSKDEDVWSTMVKEEERTDRPSLKER